LARPVIQSLEPGPAGFRSEGQGCHSERGHLGGAREESLRQLNGEILRRQSKVGLLKMTDWIALAALLLSLGTPPARAEDPGLPAHRSRGVGVLVQGGAGATDLEQPAPPPPEVTLASRPARGRIEEPNAPATPSDSLPVVSLRRVSLAEGEGTVEIDGRREVVRSGSRLGNDIVKSVSPEQLVLARPPKEGDQRGETLVIVTFDADGEARSRVFRARDISAPEAPEVKRP